MAADDRTLATSRLLSVPPDRVFAAFRDPERLARWWGPAGFTNTFERFEFRPGGGWTFTMHGPNGGDYPNESVFREIVEPSRIVIDHVSGPPYVLTIRLVPEGGGSRIGWSQVFETADMLRRLERVAGPANEENLDRLEAELARQG